MSKRFPKPKKWIPKNPDKYAGDVNNIISRSSWETKVMNFFDQNMSVVLWASEEFKIPYVSPIDNRQHMYHVDFLAKMKLRDGSFKTYAIEVKPFGQTMMPVKSNNKARYINEMSTYLVNQAKWKAATEVCKLKNVEFIVLTEKDLNV